MDLEKLLKGFEGHLGIHHSSRTVKAYMTDIRMLMRGCDSNLEIENVTLDKIEDLFKREDYAPATIARKLAALKEFGYFAMSEGICLRVGHLELNVRIKKALQSKEETAIATGIYQKIIDEGTFNKLITRIRSFITDNDVNRYLRSRDILIATLAYRAGAKSGEIIALHESDFSLKPLERTSLITVNLNRLLDSYKNREIRFETSQIENTEIASYQQQLAQFKIKRKTNNPFLVVNKNGEPFNEARSIRRDLEGYLDNTELGYITHRGLRIAYAHQLAQQGLAASQIAKRLGVVNKWGIRSYCAMCF